MLASGVNMLEYTSFICSLSSLNYLGESDIKLMILYKVLGI